MTKHRNPRPKVPKRPPPDNSDGGDGEDDLLDLFRYHAARADAFLTAAEGSCARRRKRGSAHSRQEVIGSRSSSRQVPSLGLPRWQADPR